MALNPAGIKNYVAAEGKFVIGLLMRKIKKGVYTLRLTYTTVLYNAKRDLKWLVGMGGEAQKEETLAAEVSSWQQQASIKWKRVVRYRYR